MQERERCELSRSALGNHHSDMTKKEIIILTRGPMLFQTPSKYKKIIKLTPVKKNNEGVLAMRVLKPPKQQFKRKTYKKIETKT